MSKRLRTQCLIAGLALLAVGGVGAAVSLPGTTTAAKCSPVETVSINGDVIGTRPGVCVTATATSQTVTVHDGTTVATTTPTMTTAPVTTTQPTTTTMPSDNGYPWHTNVASTTFWVGEEYKPNQPDGSQSCSTYDSQWAYDWSGISTGTESKNNDCKGALTGGCDGVATQPPAAFTCNTERRTADTSYFPKTSTGYSGFAPKENPFYVDLPYDDVNNTAARKSRCQNIPWAAGPNCDTLDTHSYMKNRWVEIVGPNHGTCYGQIEDAGPDFYDEFAYVFKGDPNRPPKNSDDNNAGMDVSPALNGCLGFAKLDDDRDLVNWRFVDDDDVPNGPWAIVVTDSSVS